MCLYVCGPVPLHARGCETCDDHPSWLVPTPNHSWDSSGIMRLGATESAWEAAPATEPRILVTPSATMREEGGGVDEARASIAGKDVLKCARRIRVSSILSKSSFISFLL